MYIYIYIYIYWIITFSKHRNSSADVFCKICGLKNFAKFTGKYLCRSPSLLIKFQPGSMQLY